MNGHRLRPRRLRGPLLLALLLGSLVLPARGEVVAELDLVSRYMWRGFDLLDRRPAAQPLIVWTRASGPFAMLRGSFGLLERGHSISALDATISEMDELNLIAGWEGALGPALVQGGIFHLAWFSRPDWPGRTTTISELFAAGSLPELPGQPALQASWELDPEGGHDLYLELMAGRTVELGEATSLYGRLHGGWHTADWIGDGFSGISDVSLRLELLRSWGLAAAATHLNLTWSGSEEINEERWIVWGGVRLTKIWSSGAP
jgi:hypothetical protein